MAVTGCGAEMAKLMDVSDQDVALIEDTITERLALGVTQEAAQRQAVDEALAQLAEERAAVMRAVREQLGPIGRSPQTEAGKRAGRNATNSTPTSDGVTRFSRSKDTIEVDGVERPRTNSKGQPIHPTEEGVRNFWRWFSNSAVVDAEGRPLVVYHGTRADFDVFYAGAPTANKWLLGVDNKNRFFFDSSPGRRSDSGPWSGAAGYAGVTQRDGETVASAGANIMPVYLALRSPYKMTAAQYRKSGSRPNFKEEVEVLGYDGVKIDDGTFIAFSNEQIKSLTGNQGTFDQTNPSIVRSQGNGPGISTGELAQVVEELLAEFVHKAPVRMLDTALGVLPGVGQQDAVSGAVYQGRIHLFRDQIPSRAAAVRTLWHELLHYGLRRFLTRDEYQAQMLELYNRDAWVRAEAKRWAASEEGRKAARQSGEDYARARGVDEALAQLAEKNQGGIENTGMGARAYRTVVDWLADMAEKFKFNDAASFLRGITSTEARQYVRGVFSKLQSDTPATSSDWAFTADSAFSRGMAAQQPSKPPPNEPTTPTSDGVTRFPSAKAIDDFGEKLGGAKKDMAPSLTKETDQGVAMFNRSRFAPGSAPISRALLDATISRITAEWQGGGQAVVVAPTFSDLPQPILAHAQKQGYDNASTDERITGVAYRGKVYLIQENIPSVELAEETLFHERVHQVLRGNASDPGGEKLKFALTSLYRKMGGRTGMQAMAQEAGVRLEGLRKQSANLPVAEQAILETEEFLAELEGRRAYEKLPAKIRRTLSEYVGALRNWLRDNGFTKMAAALGQDLGSTTLADLRHMLKGLRRQLPSAGSDAVRFMTAFHGQAQGGADLDLTRPVRRQASTFDQSHNRDALGRVKFRLGEVALHKLDAATKPLQVMFGMRMASPELRKQLRQMKTTIEEAKRTSANVAKEMSAMTEADRAMVSDIVEKMVAPGVVPPEHAVKVADAITKTMDQQTYELVELGMLSAESADRWRGRYLPRLYNRPDMLGDGLAESVKNMFRTGSPTMRGIGGGSLKGRGLFEEISVDAVEQWTAMGYEVRDPHWKLHQGKLELKDPNAPKMAKETVVVWRDWTPSERAQMGENRDALFRFVKGYTSMQRDIALGRLFNNLANNTEWARKTEAKGWVKVPDTEIEGTGGVKRYGKLAGLYVREDVMSHLSRFEDASEAMQIYREALGLWKEGKTALNPVAHFNNMMGNLSMAHFAGVSLWDAHKYVAAVRDLKTGAPMVAEARKAGLFAGSFSQEEFAQAMPKELQDLMKLDESRARRATNQVMNALAMGMRQNLRNAYEFEDSFFKYLIYSDARNQGLSPDDAVDYATRYIFTYDDLPKGARNVRDYGLPFFAWTYKAIPALLHTAAVYPWRMAAPAAVLWGINAIGYAMAAADEDDDWMDIVMDMAGRAKDALPGVQAEYKSKALEKAERDALPERMQGSSAIGTPKTIRLGYDEKTGLPIFLDASRVVPGGDMFDLNNQAGGMPVPAPFMPSHPVLSTFTALFANRDMFSGREVTDKNDTAAEAAAKRAKWMAGQLLPAISLGGYHSQRVADAIANATDSVIETPLGDFTGVDRSGLPVQPKYAAMQTLGIKARPVDLELEQERKEAREASLIRSITAEVRSLARMHDKGAASDRALSEAVRKAEDKIERIEQKEQKSAAEVD
ncbi:MAG: hypothetical protein ACKOF9_04245 [Burkholderiales bacterium]